jgi:hypothetical protein
VLRTCCALALSACAAHPAPPAASPPQFVTAPRPALDPPPDLAWPPAPPCPVEGWLTADTLVGPWQHHYSEQSPRGMHARYAERHDFHRDGTAHGLRLTRRPPAFDPVKAETGFSPVPVLPYPEEREESRGTWHLGEAGLRDVRWISDTAIRTTRDRVWVWSHDYAKLGTRPLLRGDDDVWRGELYRDELRDGVSRGLDIKISLRFDPPIGDDGPCTVEVTRELRVWGDGQPAALSTHTHHNCSVFAESVELGLPYVPADDPRVVRALQEFDLDQLARVAPDVLLAHEPWWGEPRVQALAFDPPNIWHELHRIGHCTRTPWPGLGACPRIVASKNAGLGGCRRTTGGPAAAGPARRRYPRGTCSPP